MTKRKEIDKDISSTMTSTSFSQLPGILRSSFIEACNTGIIQFLKHVKIKGSFEINIDDSTTVEFSVDDLIVHGKSVSGKRDFCLISEVRNQKFPVSKRRKRDDVHVACVTEEDVKLTPGKGRKSLKKTDKMLVVTLPSLDAGFTTFQDSIAGYPKQTHFEIMSHTPLLPISDIYVSSHDDELIKAKSEFSDTELEETAEYTETIVTDESLSSKISTRFRGKKHVAIFNDIPGSDITRITQDLNDIVAEADLMLNESDGTKRYVDVSTSTDIFGCCDDLKQRPASYYIPGNSKPAGSELLGNESIDTFSVSEFRNDLDDKAGLTVLNIMHGDGIEDTDVEKILQTFELLAENEEEALKASALKKSLLGFDPEKDQGLYIQNGQSESKITYYIPGQSEKPPTLQERLQALYDLELKRVRTLVSNDVEKFNPVVFTCLHCRKAFESSETLDNHVTSMHPSTLCHRCGKFDFTRGQVHARVCRPPFYCKICKKFISQATVCQEEHEDSHNKFTCVICDKYCENPILYSKHMNVFHPPPTKCHVCSISFESRRALATHICAGENTGVFKCPTCDMDCRNKERLLFHKLAAHGPTKGICPICKASLDANYMTHYEIHINPWKNQCGMCGNRFKSELRLKYHLKIVHDRLLPYKCRKCRMRFHTRSCLHRHQVSHLGVKSVMCPLCKMQFLSAGKRNSHLKKCAGVLEKKKKKRKRKNTKNVVVKDEIMQEINQVHQEIKQEVKQEVYDEYVTYTTEGSWQPTILTTNEYTEVAATEEYAENTIIIPIEHIQQPAEEATEIIIQNTADVGQFEEAFGNLPVGQVIEIPPEMCASGESIENILLHFASQISQQQHINQ